MKQKTDFIRTVCKMGDHLKNNDLSKVCSYEIVEW